MADVPASLPADALKVAGRCGILQARSRLGELPLRRLYKQVVHPVAVNQRWVSTLISAITH